MADDAGGDVQCRVNMLVKFCTSEWILISLSPPAYLCTLSCPAQDANSGIVTKFFPELCDLVHSK